VCPGLAEPNSPLACISAELDQCLNWKSSLDLNSLYFSLWRALQQIVYGHKISDTDQLNCMLMVDCLAQLIQDTLNRAIDQLLERLMIVIKARGVHIEFRLD